jgi:hypothetical protein
VVEADIQQTDVLAPNDIADGVAYMVTCPRHTAIGELWIMPADQLGPHPLPGQDERIPFLGAPDSGNGAAP